MLSTELNERPEVKDIISELASIDESRKQQTTTPTMYAMSERDTFFQWKLAMLFLIRGIALKESKFEMGANTAMIGGRIDHSIKYRTATLKDTWRYHYLHANYQEKSFSITAAQILEEHESAFSLSKHYRFYLDKVKNNVMDVGDLITCTNADFSSIEDLKNHGIELELLSTPDDIFGAQGKRYRIKFNSALEDKLKVDDDPAENAKNVQNFFDKLIFVVKMPSDSELDEIIKDEVEKKFKMIDREIQSRIPDSDFILKKMVLELTVPGRFLTSKDGEKMFKEAGQEMDFFRLRVLSNDYQKSLRKLNTKNTQEEIQLMSTKIEQHFSTTSSDINGNGVLRIKTIEPESTAVKVFEALDTLPD